MSVFACNILMKRNFLAILPVLALAGPAAAETECIAERDYRVCTTTTTDADGNVSVHSTDSDGNSYSLRSWSDADGVHSIDSDGNRCTITPDGETIGC